MTTDAELSQKRQEVREEIFALKEQIPSAQILNKLGLSFKPNSPGYWLSNIVLLNIIVLGPWVIIGLPLKEFKTLTFDFIRNAVIFIELFILGFIMSNTAVQDIFNGIANRIIENINKVNDLYRMLGWLKQSWSRQNVLAINLPMLAIWMVGTRPMEFLGFGSFFTSILVGIMIGIFVFNYGWMLPFISNLKEYHYEMNTFSPADSEIVNSISEILSKSMYLVTAYVAIASLVSAAIYALAPSGNQMSGWGLSIILTTIAWIMIITSFILTRSNLGAITNRAKWKTLNRIRDKINALEATSDLSDKDTAERLLRLADIHKQVMASQTKIFDLKSVSTLFSQLMLPLLGLLLGNIEKLFELFW
ncbi:MAG TPA: hypothetical protein VLA72_06520 [Anaerolineales bacterium]|nr:hypothetical protein [Anaerolineales bacterium]